jgi:hypothetical protein
MSLSIVDYASLKTALAAWMKRSSISSTAEDCIGLAESRLNRDLGEVLTNATLTGVLDSREIDVASQSVAEPLALFITTVTGQSETELQKLRDGDFPYSPISSIPVVWGVAVDKIVFNCPLLAAYSFRFKFRQRFALSDAAPTNWLLDNHPDIYLAAAIVWGGLYVDDDGKTAKWSAMLEQSIPSLKAYISRQNRGEMRVDPALSAMASGRRRSFNINTGQ